MAWIRYNPNPAKKETVDCVVRAVAVAEGMTWDEAYKALTDQAFKEKDMPALNPVWANYLESIGYQVYGIPNTCPRCYTVAQFAYDHPYGTYVLGTGSHAIAVIDGNYIDTWNSGNEIPMYFFKKGESNNVRSKQERHNAGEPVLDSSGSSAEPISDTMSVPSNTGLLGTGIGGSQGLPVNNP